jgi:hypothetical protein
MKTKMFWIASGILLVALTVYQITFHRTTVKGAEVPDYFIISVDIFAGVLTYFIFGTAPTLILSAFPYKSWSYGRKYKTLFPIMLFAVLVIVALAFGYSEYCNQVNGVKLRPVHD